MSNEDVTSICLTVVTCTLCLIGWAVITTAYVIDKIEEWLSDEDEE